jgi:general L-amino acid transport system permease protein
VGLSLLLPRDAKRRGLVIQALLLAGIVGLAALLISTTVANLERRGIPVGWDFLFEPSQVVISESLLEHDHRAATWRAIGVGIVNTLWVSLLVIVLSSLFGLLVGLARLGTHPMARVIAAVWVETARNFPPIVILIFLYSLWWKLLPPLDEAWTLGGEAELSMRGLRLPTLGWELSPELATVVLGLTIYTTGFVAEIVRAGVLAIGKGQWEAAQALGLPRAKTLRLVVVPQALRVIVPPLNSQYINVVKNSTLVIAVGYPDFLAVMNTLISKNSHSIEGVAIILGVYLAINLALSALANAYNRRIALVER